MRKLSVLLLSALVLLSITATALAMNISPYADSYFDSLTINLNTKKNVAYQAVAKEIHEEIKVTSCTLQKKSGTKWTDAGSLDAPTYVAKNTRVYDAAMDYSDDIGSGTYRISATFYADGYTVTRTSNERTYE